MEFQKNQLSLYWQPKYQTNSRQAASAEALLRWQIDNEFIPPSKFIPLAEKSGFIMNLGQWVLEQSCKQWVEWHNKGLNPLPIAMNISALQFQDHAFIQKVKEVLDKTGIPPNMLELEITEEAATEKPEKIIQTMNQLSEIGVGIALDDFGTGYSSLSNLSRFPINTMKIDRAFIMNIDRSNADLMIVKLIMDVAKQKNCLTVAEGVETEEQLLKLLNLGCDYIQGFYFSKPLPNEEYEILLTQRNETKLKMIG